MTADEIIGLLKTYVNKTLVGGGALKGKNCTIDSIAPITGGNRVTFKWTLDDGTVETGHLDVMNGLNGQDGEDGKDGKGIQSVSVNAENHLIITYSDGTTTDAGQIEIHSAVDSVNGKTGAVVLDASDVGALPANTPIPSKTSDLTNDSGFITKVVNDLVNYYLKSETYSKTQVDDIVTAVKNSRFEVVATLPTTDIKTNVIYLVPKSPSQTSNVKDEYINLDGTTAGWEKIGDTEIDLSDYVTTEALNTALAAYTTTADLTTLLAAKQDTLTFDDAPTENSNNPVKSGGVYADEKSIYEVMGEMGAKNLLPNNIYGTTSNNGITVVRNDDGSLNISGTNTSSNVISISLSDAVWGNNTKGEQWIIDDYLDRTQTYIMSISEIDVNVRMRITFYDSSHEAISDTTIDTRTHANITIPSEAVYAIVRLAFSSGQTVSTDTVVYPMIRLASITDDTYEPYAKTNQQLTEDKAEQAEVNDIVNASGSKNVLIHDLNSVYKLWEKEYSNSGSWSGRAWTFVGVTYTFNEDGSVTLSGTSTGTPINMRLAYLEGLSDGATYVLSNKGSTAQEQLKLEIDGTEVASLTGNNTYEFVYDSTKKYRLLLKCTVTGTTHDSTVYPMICLKSIYELDSTYQPPTKTNQQLTEDTTALLDNTEVNGAVNILKYPYLATTGTSSGISITDNGDGTISFAAGTVSSSSACTFWFERYATGMSAIELRGKTVKFSVDMSEALQYDSTTARIEFSIADSTDTTISGTNNRVPLNNTHNEWIVTVPSNADHFSVMLWIAKNTVLPSFTLSPMITLASYNGDYVPYAKSNKELTEDVESIEAEMVKGGGYVYKITSYFRHITITVPSNSYGLVKLFTQHGQVLFSSNLQGIVANTLNTQKVLLNRTDSGTVWTYTINGASVAFDLGVSATAIIFSTVPLEITTSNTSTPETNTMEILNLALLSNS